MRSSLFWSFVGGVSRTLRLILEDVVEAEGLMIRCGFGSLEDSPEKRRQRSEAYFYRKQILHEAGGEWE